MVHIEVFYLTLIKSSEKYGSEIMIERCEGVDLRFFISAWSIVLMNGVIHIYTMNFIVEQEAEQIMINNLIINHLRQAGEIG